MKRGDLVKLSAAGRRIEGMRKNRIGVITAKPREASYVSVRWDFATTPVRYHTAFLAPAPEARRGRQRGSGDA